MTEGPFPRPPGVSRASASRRSSRFATASWSCWLPGQKVWRFEGGEPWMHDAGPDQGSDGRRARAQPDAVRAVLGHLRAAPGDPREGPLAQWHPGRRREPDRRQRRDAGTLRGVRDAARAGRRSPDVFAVLDADRRPRSPTTRPRSVLVPTAAARRKGLLGVLAAPRRRGRSSSTGTPRTIPTGDVFIARRDRRGRARSRASAASPSSPTRPTKTSSTRASRPSRSASLPGMCERTISCFHALEELLDDGLAARATSSRPKRYQTAIKTVVLYTTNGVSTPTQWAGRRSADARYRVRRRLARRLSIAARPPRRGTSGRGLRDWTAPRAALYLFPEDPVVAPAQTRGRPRGHSSTARRSRRCPGSSSVPRARATCVSRFSVSDEMIAGGVEALQTFAAAAATR